MTKIVQFPNKVKKIPPLPRQRVFYLGYRYVGPFLCQEGQNLYLKRKGKKNNSRKWAMITYGKYDEYDNREHSIELAECDENDLPQMLTKFDMGNVVTFDELKEMGWNGKTNHNVKIIQFDSKNKL